MKKAIYSLLLPLFLLSCSSNQEPKPPTQELRFSIVASPSTFDPRKATDNISCTVIKMCFEGLMRRGLTGEIEPALTDKIVVSQDETLYRFYLKDSVWTDGTSVSAKDFVETWGSTLDPYFTSEACTELYVIKNAKAIKEGLLPVEELGVRAVGKKILEVELEKPIPYFLSLLASTPFLPVKSDEKNQPLELYTGNGPYKISNWNKNEGLVFERNNLYWDAKAVKMDKLYLYVVTDENKAFNMFEEGKLDWVGHPLSTIPLEKMTSLKQERKLRSYPIAATYYYVFNTSVYPLNNSHLRKALSLAIPRKDIVSNVLQDNQIPATGFVPPILWRREVCHFNPDSRQEAVRQLDIALKEMGITKDELPPLVLSFNSLSLHQQVAEYVKQQWEETLGIKVQIEGKEWKYFVEDINAHRFQIARMGSIATIDDPARFLEAYDHETCYNNYSHWANQEYSKLLKIASYTSDPQKRSYLLQEAEKILIREMPIAPVYFYMGSYIKRSVVHGVRISYLGDVDFKHAYIENDAK